MFKHFFKWHTGVYTNRDLKRVFFVHCMLNGCLIKHLGGMIQFPVANDNFDPEPPKRIA